MKNSTWRGWPWQAATGPTRGPGTLGGFGSCSPREPVDELGGCWGSEHVPSALLLFSWQSCVEILAVWRPQSPPRLAEAPGEGELGIQQFSVSTRTQGPWRRADITWTVSHSGGNLASVRTELRSGTTVLDSQTSSVGGSSATGEHSVRTRTGTPNNVRFIVTDGQGNTLIEEQVVSF